jgi:ribosome maturation factor RimP
MFDIESKIKNLVEGALDSLGFSIVQIKFTGTQSKVLQILIERKDEEKVNVSDCRIVSNHVSAILDVEDVISDKYHLEVSSPGIERPLVKKEDFNRFAGNVIVVRLKQAKDGRKTYKGKLLGMKGEEVEILDQEARLNIGLDFDNIKSSNIVLTDELYKEILKKAK